MNAPAARHIAIPRVLHVGHGSLAAVGDLLAGNDFDLRRVLVGSGSGPSRVFAGRVIAALRDRGARVLPMPGLNGRLDQAAAAAASIIEEQVTLAVAVGGGRVIDPVKLAAARTCVDFVSVPTTASNDGICSPVASLVGRDGGRSSHAAALPSAIVVDIGAIRSAPPATVRAGVGDLVSNLTACLDWRMAERHGHAAYDAFSAMIAESAARPVLDLDEVSSDAALELVAEGLVLSGLAMAAAGSSRPCSGSEHLISHALDLRLGSAAGLHGAQVALGALITARAHDSPLLESLRALYRRLGLPTSAGELGMTSRHLVDAVVAAPSLRPGRWTVLSDERYRDPARAAALVAAACMEATPVADSSR